MKIKINNKRTALLLILVISAILAACTPAAVNADEITGRQGNGQYGNGGEAERQQIDRPQPVFDTEITPAEADGLLFMREEEKLAHDVYIYLYEKWNNQVFQNIAGSESTHVESIRYLMEQFGIEDTASDQFGVFINSDLQDLYEQLTSLGSRSLLDALQVGAAIEEIDILDLEEFLSQTENENIALVYQNLLDGSENHLRAFVRVISNQTGSDYTPQYMSQGAFDQILADSAGNGIWRKWKWE